MAELGASEQAESRAPFYVPQADEVEVFESAFHSRLPVLLLGPTGCGKTRFLEYMSWRLGDGERLPLTTVACHEDLTAGDLVGRYLLKSDETVWVDGPLTTAVRTGGICYLDEIVEARKDTTVIVHPLTDHRRFLSIEALGATINAHPSFLLVVSYNPGYQSTLKELKPSTRQRFVAIRFELPQPDVERRVVVGETGVHDDIARMLVDLANHVRALERTAALDVPSTRLLVYAAQLIRQGVSPTRACETAITHVVTEDADTVATISELISAHIAE